jgi:hypothetical protein
MRNARNRLHALGHLRAGEALREDDPELVQQTGRSGRHGVRRAAAAGHQRDDG